MATGRLGASDITSVLAGTNVVAYTVPASTYAVVTVSFCNRSNTAAAIRLAVASADTPTNAEYVEFDTEIMAKGVLERTGLVLDAGKRIVAYSSSDATSVIVMGIETAA
jgi:hypothetical protein